MKATLPNLKDLARRWPLGRSQPETAESMEEAALEVKPPPPLSLFFMLSHLEEDGPVRLDGVKLAVLEVMGLELDEPKLGAFAGSLNAVDFPVQLLVRQHPPVLQGLRTKLDEAQPGDLPKQTKDAADSLGRLLTTLETREGILDRRFYAVCEHARADELRALLVRAGLGVFPLAGNSLKLLLLACVLGGSPDDRDEDAETEVEVNRRETRIGNRLVRSLHLGKWPRSLAPGFLQGLMAAGAPMDLAVHLGAIPAEQAARSLEWQKVRFESAQSLSFKRGRSLSPEAEIALEDVSRLRDEVQRGRERLFHASLSVTLHADDHGHPEGPDSEGEGPTSPPRWASWTTWPSGKGRVCFRLYPWRSTPWRCGGRWTPPAWRDCSPSRRRTWTPAAAPSTASTCGPAPPSSTTPSTALT